MKNVITNKKTFELFSGQRLSLIFYSNLFCPDTVVRGSELPYMNIPNSVCHAKHNRESKSKVLFNFKNTIISYQMKICFLS